MMTRCPQDLLRVRCRGCGQQLERRKGLKVASKLTCLVCGQETEVQGVPLEAIREKSLKSERLLSQQLEWAQGIVAAKECQVSRDVWISISHFLQELFDQHLVAPSIDLYTCQISIWRALWLIVGNRKLVRGIL